MPSPRSIPTIDDYLDAAAKAVVANGDAASNTRRGAMYDRAYGPCALLWTRQGIRDRDMFRAIHFDTAQGTDLTTLGDRYGVPRQVDTYGSGKAIVKRATAGAGAGTIWAGTQIGVTSGAGGQAIYVALADTAVGASDLMVSVPIGATVRGSAGGTSVTAAASFVDTLFDLTLYVESLTCAPGVDLEAPDEFRGRTREALRSARAGYTPAMIAALRAAGAVMAVLLPPDYSGIALDLGISACYVGDGSSTGSAAIVQSCTVALESVRVLGCDLEVLPMAPTTLTVTLSVTYWDPRSSKNKLDIENRIRLGLVRYFADSANAFAYKLDAIVGAVVAAAPEVKDVTLALPAADATLSATAWPASLPLYRVSYAGINLSTP